VASAGFEITEVMYDLDGTDTDREWIEVQNTGSEALDLSTWYFFSDNSKHSLVPEGVSLVPAGGHAVIAQKAAKFTTDWSSFSGLLFDSSWTGFNNEGESIALKDSDLNIVSPITFTASLGGAGNGDSLQKINGSWVGATPTPGAANSTGNNSTETTTQDQSNSQTNTSSGGGVSLSADAAKKVKESEIPHITTDILAKSTVFAGVPLTIDTRTIGINKEGLATGRFVWNFGDGTAMHLRDQKEFEHTYAYPGEYVLSLSYYSNYYGTTVDATNRMIVRVVPLEILIGSVGTPLDPFVELENRSAYELSLSGWRIIGASHSFIIPEGTMILPNKKLKFSPRVTFFTNDDIKSVTLQNAGGETVALYPVLTQTPPLTSEGASVVKSQLVSSMPKKAVAESTLLEKEEPIVDLNTLGANAHNPVTTVPHTTLAWYGLVGVIIVGSLSVFLIRRKDTSADSLEKEICAEDMTIIE
jgi:hypothetical protein